MGNQQMRMDEMRERLLPEAVRTVVKHARRSRLRKEVGH